MQSAIGIVAVLGFLNIFTQAQDYIIEDPENRRYILQQRTPTEPTTNPYHQNSDLQGVGLQNGDFYVPSDLQTSDLPAHLQQTLLQYRPQTLNTAAPNDHFPNTHFNVPESSRLHDYISPSTHRPNYSHLLPHGNLHNSLQLTAHDPSETAQYTNDNLYNSDDDTFDTEQNEQKAIGTAKNESINTVPKKGSISKNYGHSNSLDVKESGKEDYRQSRQETKATETVDNDPAEDYEVYTQSNETKKSKDDKENQNYIEDEEEYDEDYLDEDEENIKENNEYDDDQTEDKGTTNKTYDILTIKPMVTSEENAYHDFVDTDFMDTTTQESASSEINTELPMTLFSSADRFTKLFTKPLTTEAALEENIFPDYVVSVVTSKTIVNNTIISPGEITETPTSTPIKSDSHKEETSTDSWIVVASVQTSKSISGARYLPSSVVEQHNINISLTEPNDNIKHLESENESEDWSVETTTSETITTTNSKSSTRFKTSTESLIDKLDRVQSDLSSGLLAGGFKNDNIAVIDENTQTKMDTITEVKPTLPPITSTTIPYPQVNIRKFNPGGRAFRPRPKELISRKPKPVFTTTSKPSSESDIPNPEDINKDSASIYNIAKPVDDISALLPPGYTTPKSTSIENPLDLILAKAKPIEDISALLPPGFKPPKPTAPEKSIEDLLAKAKPVEDISALLPPGFNPSKPASSEKSSSGLLAKAKPVEDISALLPPGFNPSKPASSEKSSSGLLAKAKPVEDISALLPPGFKQKAEEEESNSKEENGTSKILSKAKPVADISSLLPSDFKSPKRKPADKSATNILAKAKPVDDISALLPPGYRGFSGPKGHKATTTTTTTAAPVSPEVKSQNILNNLLPPGYKLDHKNSQTTVQPISMSTNSSATEGTSNTSAKSKEVKLVFPSRPGGGSRKTSRLTTSKTPTNAETNRPTSPIIQKGWPVRSSTEFTGWPTPSTTPISIEKLLEAARNAASSTSTVTPTTASSTTSTTKPTTTTPKPTTPGICVGECDLAGTIKLVGGAKWVPELLDRYTKEWQILANDVQDELESIYSSSPMLKGWYRKIRIDGFSEGSVLVDYVVELSEIGKKINTQEMKHLFHESLTEVIRNNSGREGKSLNETKLVNRVSLGQFELDPKFTDFVVIPKQSVPTMGYGDDNILLPQWAIAVIVIGLASLLFVIIFGVTVLVNRHKNSKKSPAPLTEDMLNELNKNHMGGLENYAVEDDFYNLEDVWGDKPYEPKSHKKRTNDSVYDNSMSNLYDSWRSQWNGSYDNRYDANVNHSQHNGYVSSRRPKYDTDF